MPEALRKQLGPFTLGVWLLIVVGGLALGLVVRRFMGGFEGGSDAPDPAAGATAGVGTGGFLTQGAAAVNLNGGGGYGGDDSAPKTNDEWVRYATQFLIGRGQNSLDVDTALRKYVTGLPMSAKDGAIVALAIQLVGSPPEPVPAADVAPTTPVPGTPAPAAPQPPPNANVSPQVKAFATQSVAWLAAMEYKANRQHNRGAGGVQAEPWTQTEIDQAKFFGYKSTDWRLPLSFREYWRQTSGGK